MVVYRNVVVGSRMIRFSLVIGHSKPDMPGMELWPIYRHTSGLTNELLILNLEKMEKVR